MASSQEKIARKIALENLGNEKITQIRHLGKGQYYLELNDGGRYFLKLRENPPGGFFEAESRSYKLLSRSRYIKTPKLIAWDRNFIILEWVETSSPNSQMLYDFGRQLALFHDEFKDDEFGLSDDGYIGELFMPNTKRAQWQDFYFENRIMPYCEMAENLRILSGDHIRDILSIHAKVINVTEFPTTPKLIHGDLWAGNILFNSNGAVLIDPCSYFGLELNDLAMLDLFPCVGYDRIIEGYLKQSRLDKSALRWIPLFQIFPLLVHVVLFGTSYLAPLFKVISDSKKLI